MPLDRLTEYTGSVQRLKDKVPNDPNAKICVALKREICEGLHIH